jgi:MFS family permease
MVAGEAVMTVALADSLFLSISPDAARGRVILFLALSLAPFAVVAPFIGPLVDRMKGGRRLVVILAAALRALVSFLMIGRIDSLTLFPLAFAALVLSKTYAVSKSALVPTVVPEERELVDANSKLGLLSGVVGFVAAVPAALVQFISPNATLAISSVVFVTAVLSAWHLPRDVRIAASPRTRVEIEELRSRRVRRAVAAMRLMRGLVGLMFFHLAFWLRDQKAGTVWFGFAVSLASIATMSANAVAPIVRRRLREETMIIVALGAVGIGGIVCTWIGGVTGGVILAATVNAFAATCKLAYEAVVQSDAPDANRARAFASFETQFQLAWVGAGLVPVVLRLPGEFGFFVVGLVGCVGMLLFVLRMRAARQSRGGRATGRARRPRRA